MIHVCTRRNVSHMYAWVTNSAYENAWCGNTWSALPYSCRWKDRECQRWYTWFTNSRSTSHEFHRWKRHELLHSRRWKGEESVRIISAHIHECVMNSRQKWVTNSTNECVENPYMVAVENVRIISVDIHEYVTNSRHKWVTNFSEKCVTNPYIVAIEKVRIISADIHECVTNPRHNNEPRIKQMKVSRTLT